MDLVTSSADRGGTCTFPDLEAFVDRVLCDGRYVHTFQNDPGQVADRLGVALPPALAEEISRASRGQLVGLVWTARLRAAKYGDQADNLPEVWSPDVYIVVVVVAIVIIAAIVIIRTVWYPDPRRSRVEDKSPNKDHKL